MTEEDLTKTLLATYNSIELDLGLLGDLPLELANTVANVYFRYFEMSVSSSPPLTNEEIATREVHMEAVREAIPKFRVVKQQSPDPFITDNLAECLVEVYSYGMTNAPNKMFILRKIERRFRKNKDIPELVTKLQLYK